MSRSIWIPAAAAVLLFAGAAWAQGVAGGPNVQIKVFDGSDVQVEAARPSKFWIGVALAGPVQASEDEPGLKVVKVMPDSPAAKAGIEPGDRLLKAGKIQVKTIGDLTKAVNTSQGKPLAIEAARDGKVVKLEVTPVERAVAMPFPDLPMGDDAESLKRWVENLQKGHFDKAGPLQFRFFGPGAIVPGPTAGEPQPDDMTITITKKGDRPARVVVKQGDETWKATTDTLDELPDEVRPHVDRLLGRGFGGWGRVRVHEGPQVHVKPLEPRVGPAPERIRRQMDEKLEQLRKQMEQMNKRIDELHKRQVEPAKKPDKV